MYSDISEDKFNAIIESLKRRRPYSKIAKEQRISVHAVRDIDIEHNGRYVTSGDGYGRQAIRRFILSRRVIDQKWPARDLLDINKARADYDNGLIEMATGRDGKYQILYRFPRKVKAKRTPYFKEDYDAT